MKIKLRKCLNDIYENVQRNNSTRQKCLIKLQNLFKDSNFDEFLQEFKRNLIIIFKVKCANDPYKDKLLTFISTFCTSLNKPEEDASNNLLREIFTFILTINLDYEKICAYRVCQFVNLLLKRIGEQESFLEEDICERIRKVMLEQIYNAKPRIKIQAIEILQRLQDPLNQDDLIINTFIDCLGDSNAQVRKAIVQCLGWNLSSIQAVASRCLDVNDEVRLASYEKLAKIPIKALKIVQRQFILRNGLSDKNSAIVSFVSTKLLPLWLSNCDDDYIRFIQSLKLDADEQDFHKTTALVEKILAMVFKNSDLLKLVETLPLGKDKLVVNSDGSVVWEELIFWRCLQHLLREQQSDCVDRILPELVFFCEYMNRVYKTKSNLNSDWELLQHNQIMLELYKICKEYDLSDEVGRGALSKLISQILVDVQESYDNILLLVEIYAKLFPDVNERARNICEIIADIQSPLVAVIPNEEVVRKRDVKLAEFRYKLMMAQDKQELAIEREQFSLAEELKHQIAAIKQQMTETVNAFNENQEKSRVVKTDRATLCCCMDIIVAFLQPPTIITLPEDISLLQNLFLPPLLASQDSEVFWRALRTLCVFCDFDKTLAVDSVNLFTEPLLAHKYRPIYDDQVTIVAMSCITDMILTYGAEIFAANVNVQGKTTEQTNKRKLFDNTQVDETVASELPSASLELVIEIMSELLDDCIAEVREVAGVCLVKLVGTERIRSPTLFSKLLLKWFNPNTSHDVRLRQVIGRLFIDYVPERRSSCEIIEQAFLPTLKAILDAPTRSPLAEIDVDSVAQFLAALSHSGCQSTNIHANIAHILCNEICVSAKDNVNKKHLKCYLKALPHLEPPFDDEQSMDDLKEHVMKMRQIILDKQLLQHVEKYQHRLNAQNTLANTFNSGSATTVQSLPLQDDCERYSCLSVQRRKRHSGEDGNDMQDITPKRVLTILIERNSYIDKLCAQQKVHQSKQHMKRRTKK